MNGEAWRTLALELLAALEYEWPPGRNLPGWRRRAEEIEGADVRTRELLDRRERARPGGSCNVDADFFDRVPPVLFEVIDKQVERAELDARYDWAIASGML